VQERLFSNACKTGQRIWYVRLKSGWCAVQKSTYEESSLSMGLLTRCEGVYIIVIYQQMNLISDCEVGKARP
jgi:hypothetical protein